MPVPLDICCIIAEYVVPKKILDWIRQKIPELEWFWLSET